MDFVTLLKRDHEKFLSLFHQIQRGFDQPDTSVRHQLFRQLKSELELHAAVEDLHVYRVFQQSELTHDDAYEAQETHAKIKTILETLETAQVYDHKWVSQFHELQQLVETHVGRRRKRDVSQSRGVHDAARSGGARCCCYKREASDQP